MIIISHSYGEPNSVGTVFNDMYLPTVDYLSGVGKKPADQSQQALLRACLTNHAIIRSTLVPTFERH